MTGHDWTDFHDNERPIEGFCTRCHAKCGYVWNEAEEHWVRETKATFCLEGPDAPMSVVYTISASAVASDIAARVAAEIEKRTRMARTR